MPAHHVFAIVSLCDHISTYLHDKEKRALCLTGNLLSSYRFKWFAVAYDAPNSHQYSSVFFTQFQSNTIDFTQYTKLKELCIRVGVKIPFACPTGLRSLDVEFARWEQFATLSLLPKTLTKLRVWIQEAWNSEKLFEVSPAWLPDSLCDITFGFSHCVSIPKLPDNLTKLNMNVGAVELKEPPLNLQTCKVNSTTHIKWFVKNPPCRLCTSFLQRHKKNYLY